MLYNGRMRIIRKLIPALFLFFVLTAFSANADVLGQNQQFFINSQYDSESRNTVVATLRHISDRAYFYVADEYWNSTDANTRNWIISRVQAIGQEFDSRIYPLETQFFGSEPNPGVDGDPRVTFVLAPLLENVGGYYDSANQYVKRVSSNSNEREMIYLNVGEIGNPVRVLSFLAHEFQHLISFNQKEKLRNAADDVWLNELRSEYAVTLLGYNGDFNGSHLQRRSQAFLDEPHDSLTEWKNLRADYGQIGMLGQYLAEHWSPQVIAGTLKNNLAGVSSLNESLARNGFTDNFLDVYRNWLIANILNGDSNVSKWGYIRDELKKIQVVPTKIISNLGDEAIFALTDTIKDWQGRWYGVANFSAGRSDVLKITFLSSSLTSFQIAYIVFKSDGSKDAHVFYPTPRSDAVYLTGINTDFGRVVVIPIKKDKFSGFTSNESPVKLTTVFERITSTSVSMPIINPPVAALDSESLSHTTDSPRLNLPDGSLIRAENDYKVYIIQGKWRRHILSPEIFKFYAHLGFDKVKTIPRSVLDQYNESSLIRYASAERVYAVDQSGKRKWLNMSPQQFSASGYNWDAVFSVNLRELQFYTLGPKITQ